MDFMKFVLLCIALIGVTAFFVLNQRLKRSINSGTKGLDIWGQERNWGTPDCDCGTQRRRWKVLAMNRPDNTVLLLCPQCKKFWEEKMTVYKNMWRKIDSDYANTNYEFLLALPEDKNEK
jgi:hypothetical protein